MRLAQKKIFTACQKSKMVSLTTTDNILVLPHLTAALLHNWKKLSAKYAIALLHVDKFDGFLTELTEKLTGLTVSHHISTAIKNIL